jgi:hypothetical protein
MNASGLRVHEDNAPAALFLDASYPSTSAKTVPCRPEGGVHLSAGAEANEKRVQRHRSGGAVISPGRDVG